jgi:hypoxanthine phosphoribosyltransferase
MILLQKNITLHDLTFEPFISSHLIETKVTQIAHAISHDYVDSKPMVLVIMNGAFVYAADLVRHFEIQCDIEFINIKSYQGTESKGDAIIQWPDHINVTHRDLIIVEDIIDTGNTMAKLIPFLASKGPRSIAVTAILIKPDAAKHQIDVKYPGIIIPNHFVVGYGLDYNGLGRNLKDVYQLKQ